MSTIAVIGASGFVGTAVVERLSAIQSGHRVLPFIHTSGNAMGLARRGLEVRFLDLLDSAGVNAALKGVTHVINCSRGGDDVMIQGLHNLLVAGRKQRIKRFVHLSSVAVYGDPPTADSATETGRTAPKPGSYGWTKLKQDRMVMRAADAGLPSVVLCPPNISGPGSYFLVALVDALQSGTFALLEDGSAPCNLVDVANLAHAIELGLENGPADGTRMFVTDDEATTWGSVIDALLPLAECAGRPPCLSREALVQHNPETRKPSISLIRSLKHVFSSGVREAMRKDPLWERIDTAFRTAVGKLGRSVEDRVRLAVEGPLPVPKMNAKPKLSPLALQQLRGVRHSCSRAKTMLGYQPLYSGAESTRAFGRWYRHQHGMDTAMWPLLRQLAH